MTKILLIISGGIAAVKSYDLVRSLRSRGHDVTVILTKAAQEFVTSTAMTTLSGKRCYTDLFDNELESDIGHIALARNADLILIAPATAHLIGQMALGLCSDLATTCLMASDNPILIAPAMNVRMWDNISFQKNLSFVQSQQHITIIPPEYGSMACGEIGVGRMAEVDRIIHAIDNLSQQKKLLLDKEILITAGPTIEKIDPVRYISNFSSGKQGFALAKEAANLGAKVTLISGQTTENIPPHVKYISVLSAEEMLSQVLKNMPRDYAIFTAAVCDYKPQYHLQKIKKDKNQETLQLEMIKNPDILYEVSHHKQRPKIVIGFAAETENFIENGRKKLHFKGCDKIYVNDVSETSNIFGSDENQVVEITASSEEKLEKCHKNMVARWILQRLIEP